MHMRAFVPSCYNNPQAAYSFSKVLWVCQLYPRESSLLGMEKENIPPTKKAKVSLSLKKSYEFIKGIKYEDRMNIIIINIKAIV